MRDGQDTMSDRDWEQGAVLLLRVRQFGAARDVASLDEWIEAEPSRQRIVQQLEQTWAASGSLGGNARVKSWIDDVRTMPTTAHTGPFGWRPGTSAGWAVAASLVLAMFVALLLLQNDLFRAPPDGDLIATGFGEQKNIQLADGSSIFMDAASTIRVNYTDEVRQVEFLKGQANFDVTHDTARPFRVRLGDREVVVLGTQFNVLREGKALQVSLYRGKVQISRLRDEPGFLGYLKSTKSVPLQTLSPGQQYAQGENGGSKLREFDTFAVSAWEKGLIVFDNTSLEDAATALNRRARTRLSIAPALKSRRVSGVFRSGDTLTFARIVAGFYPNTKVAHTETEVVLSQ